MQQKALGLLQKYWGHQAFRPLQQEIIQSVLHKKDTMALLPTGGGKSVCFQLPTLMMDGICIVVSPLIALMKDQVYNLNKKGIKAVAIFSGMSHRQIDTALDNCVFGDVKFLYVSPERLETEDFKVRVQKMNVCLLAVDEAHCISQWGYDFRPPYLNIAALRDIVKNIPVIALTATATPQVVDDIQEKLRFAQHNVFRKSFVRKNLSYVVRKTVNTEKSLLDIIQKVKGTAVVYARNRRLTRHYSELLKRHGIQSDFYHAGLETAARMQKQEDWIKNKTRVICCTNAFGMGIDKPDVRLVVHTDVADSLEAYFQEAGRAGRDEKKAYAVQLIHEDDPENLNKKIANGFPELAFVRELYEAIYVHFRIPYNEGAGITQAFDLGAFSESKKMQVSQVISALKILQQQQLFYLNENPSDTSQIKIICTKAALFEFMERQKIYEPLIKMLLRTTEGLFEDYVYAEEWLIAHRMNTDELKVFQWLKDLHKLKVIDYKMLVNKPRITILKDRVSAAQLRLDIPFLEQRKKDYQQKLKAVLEYITNEHICRTQMLVQYFGEKEAEPCGVCDICIAQNKTGLSSHDFGHITKQIQKKLMTGPQQPDIFFKTLSTSEHTLREVLDFMMQNGTIEKTKDGRLRLQE